MGAVYIEAYYDSDWYVNLETLIVCYVHKLTDVTDFPLKVVRRNSTEAKPSRLIRVDLKGFDLEEVLERDVPKIATYCQWPVSVTGATVTAGLCSVCRKIIKASNNVSIQKLLGFREASLAACSESSIWTRFCEIDMPRTVRDVLNSDDIEVEETLILPKDLTRFEHHMAQPVRLHNVYKIARKKNGDNTIKSNVPLEKLNLEHVYGEGCFKTIADVILYPSFKILLSVFSQEVFVKHLPLTLKWYNNLESDFAEFPAVFVQPRALPPQILQEEIAKESLYIADPSRYKPQSRIHTRQVDVENSLQLVKRLNLPVENSGLPFGQEVPFDWSQIPSSFQMVPDKRLERKLSQLENLARATLQIVKDQSLHIVDFCSGSGHLGILLARLLPNCKVTLVENKERSLERAVEHSDLLKLPNVTVLQCNLDYFRAPFDLGTCLHACGVATDLVIATCIQANAHFVSCPCCYGSIKNCHSVTYPLSRAFAPILYEDYLKIAHAADQTHVGDAKRDQGYFCMDLVDTDRKLYAEGKGYEVHLCKLQPETCTPKNNLLVGLWKGEVH